MRTYYMLCMILFTILGSVEISQGRNPAMFIVFMFIATWAQYRIEKNENTR